MPVLRRHSNYKAGLEFPFLESQICCEEAAVRNQRNSEAEATMMRSGTL